MVIICKATLWIIDLQNLHIKFATLGENVHRIGTKNVQEY